MYKLLLILLIVLAAKLEAQNISSSKELSLYFDQPEVLKKAGINNVRCLFKDSRKLIWIGTDNGLFRYDGTNTIYQRHKPGDTTSIPDNKIVSIKEDKIGNIWLGTLAGVACMNPYDFKCKVYRNELHNLDGNFDNKILVGPSGEIWTGNNDGLFLLNKKTNRFEKVWYNILPGKPVSAYITSLLYWKPDTLVLGTFNNIVLVNTKNFGFRRVAPLITDVLIDNLWVDNNHRLWIGTWGDGCLIGNSILTKFQQYKWEPDLLSGVDNIVFSFAETTTDDAHNMWIGTNSGLSKIPFEDPDEINLSHAMIYKAGAGEKNNDPGNFNYLWADEENYLWSGSSSGISKFYAGKNLFQEVPINIKGSVENMQSINFSNKNYLAVSSWHGPQGIVFWNRETNKTKIIDSIEHDQFGSNISGVAVDKYNRLWLASLSGVFLLNAQFGVINSLSKTKNSNDIPSGKKANDILINNDTVWIACYKNGIDLYDLHLHKLKHFIDQDGSGLVDNLVERFYKDKRGNIWLCGNSYFYKYLPSTASFKKFDFSIEHAGYTTYDIAEMDDGHLVIATDIGLVYFDPLTEVYQFIQTPLLEKEENISSVTSDINNNIWYLTTNHLVQYQPELKRFTLFGEEDGLNTNALQLLRCLDGRHIFLAEDSRLLMFSPEQWQKEIFTPQILIHSIQVNDSIIQSAQPLHELHLGYKQNKIYFEFDGITYTKPEQNLYAYKLTGVDKDWITSNKNSVSYANLSPGHYQFYVKTANYTGVWSKEYVIDIFIAPPFWLTWWFISIAILAVGSMFVFVIRYISQRNLRERILRLEKEQAVEKERNRIARDMHDDLGSGLTKIAILSEVAKTQLKEKEAATMQLENISHSSRELVDNLQNIIWVLNPKNDSLENLSAYIREYALKFFESTETIVHFNYPQQIPSIKLSEEQRRNIFMAIKETLNNIAKHSRCNKVEIGLSLKKYQLQIEINDDGKGFEMSSVRQFANGLNNMKQRMEQINGSYEIQSACDKGTVTRLVIPL